MQTKKILVVGASGSVGSSIVSLLFQDNSYTITIAGRRKEILEKLNLDYNNSFSILPLNIHQITDFSFLKNFDLLIMGLDIPNDNLPKACVQFGVHYLDISASESVYNLLKSLHQEAQNQNVKLLFSVGLAPGLTNILAKYLYENLDQITDLELFVMLGLGEIHGDQAFQWTFDNLHKEYFIHQNNKSLKVKNFT